ncbi:MAG: sulfite exporter TauE/SafE family protein [Ruminococcaceae bacterium]|nr:sulfite exporter TauE/SafE family protein [Oscillospiraceae bacterium]
MVPDKKSIKDFSLAATAGVAAGFINGFLGAGGGIILLWILGRLNPDKGAGAVRDNFASVVAVVLLLSCVSAVTYSHTSNIETASLLTLALPGMAGGVAGAYLTDRLNTKLLKLAFSVLIVIAGINMVF